MYMAPDVVPSSPSPGAPTTRSKDVFSPSHIRSSFTASCVLVYRWIRPYLCPREMRPPRRTARRWFASLGPIWWPVPKKKKKTVNRANYATKKNPDFGVYEEIDCALIVMQGLGVERSADYRLGSATECISQFHTEVYNRGAYTSSVVSASATLYPNASPI